MDLRIQRQSENALKAAKFLEDHSKVPKVYYPGLDSHPDSEVAKKQMNPFSGMPAFELADVNQVTELLNNRLRLVKLAMDVGDITTLIEFLSYQTHWDVDIEIKERIGITDQLLRLSVGIEDVEDIIVDIDQALSQI